MRLFKYLCLKIIIVLALYCLSLSSILAKEYNVKYGKFTHIKTNGAVIYKIIGNETWDIQPSPMGDGVFIWARKNSIPVNVKLYTKTHEFEVNLSPHSTNHTGRIIPVGLALLLKNTDIAIIQSTDTEKLQTSARNKILEQKAVSHEKEISKLPNEKNNIDDTKINVNVVNDSGESVLAIPVERTNEQFVAAVTQPEPINEPSKSIEKKANL